MITQARRGCQRRCCPRARPRWTRSAQLGLSRRAPHRKLKAGRNLEGSWVAFATSWRRYLNAAGIVGEGGGHRLSSDGFFSRAFNVGSERTRWRRDRKNPSS